MAIDKISVVIILITLTGIHAQGQLSPGPLTMAHAELEGIRNCTQCHDIGNKIPDLKCLACHTEIENLQKEQRGYHASAVVKNQECIDCHSEHHGRKFDMVRFDQDNFDHTLTGYDLEGQHGVIECRECHKAEYISDPEIGSRPNTFLGLEEDCLGCHFDFHQQTLSNDCVSCHNFAAFRPAPLFDHDQAKFKLNGRHVDVGCISCHIKTTRNDLEFQNFTGLSFNSCVSCHDDPHDGGLAASCATCHNENSFSNFTGGRFFDHDRTGFELKGSHQTTDCFACHDQFLEVKEIFQEFDGTSTTGCNSCHDDVHEGKFGSNCVECHNEESFLLLNSRDIFDHNLTDYPLVGKRIEVDCKECHLGRYTDDIAFSRCIDCHDDYHNGEFIRENPNSDCLECHDLEIDFSYTLFSADRHQDTNFPLVDAHLATPCFSCHLTDEKWTFKEIGFTCIDCHDDIHQGYISETYYPNQNCTSCHSSSTWDAVDFDHTTTAWPLEGKHIDTQCASCHFQDLENNPDTIIQIFNELTSTCITCHENIHGDQFSIDGVTDCHRCHQNENWEPILFDHDITAFPLDGKHRGLDCSKCHTSDTADDQPYKSYNIDKFECIDCHL